MGNVIRDKSKRLERAACKEYHQTYDEDCEFCKARMNLIADAIKDVNDYLDNYDIYAKAKS